MKKPIISNKFLIACLCIFLFLFVYGAVSVYQYIKASQLKIVEDIRSSDSTLLQSEFGIELPPQTEITCLGYCSDLIVIRIEGIEDLDSFLTNSMHWELDPEESQKLSDDIIKVINSPREDMYEDMYGTERNMTFFLNSNYQTNPIHYSATTYFFILDGKLVIEISKTDTTTENREKIKEILNR